MYKDEDDETIVMQKVSNKAGKGRRNLDI